MAQKPWIILIFWKRKHFHNCFLPVYSYIQFRIYFLQPYCMGCLEDPFSYFKMCSGLIGQIAVFFNEVDPCFPCSLTVCRCLTWNWVRSSTFHRTKRKVDRLLRSCLTSSSTVRLWSSLVTNIFYFLSLSQSCLFFRDILLCVYNS